jgi:CarD family transcriptional regulator
MLIKARQVLVSELALAQKSTEEEAFVTLDDVLNASVAEVA